MWIIYAIIVHVLLLGSVFIIYFRSPVITGLQPQNPLKSSGQVAPAKRLVLIVTDGLRAESFFEKNCSHVPHLRDIFIEQGIVGVSRTRVPTESRPGHIALIAGLYEDPSAVTRGWKANPIEFDTLFNRSDQTYAWGNSEVLGIFSRLSDGQRPMHFDSYDDIDFTGQEGTYKQDKWVFERVPLLLERKKRELQNADHVVFFLHLLGLDTAGHVHKPGTKLFLENLHYTEREIANIYRLFERYFPDGRTSYLLTSDHGMTDGGSHGAGATHETDTPFFLWGAGVAKEPPSTGKTFQANAYTKLPLYELEQAQLTPLMSALLGLPPPMNNFGTLPIGYINASAEYEAHAVHSNTLQLLAQYQRLLKDHERGVFSEYLRKYHLSVSQIYSHNAYVSHLLKVGQYNEMVGASMQMMKYALEGIDYYQGYYRNMLLVSTTITFFGWILYLLQQLIQDERNKNQWKLTFTPNIITTCFCGIGTILLAFANLQKVPFGVGFYLFLPVPIWLVTMQEHKLRAIKQKFGIPIVPITVLIACIELLVFAFFDRRLISAGFLLYAATNCRSVFRNCSSKFYLWLLLVLVLAVFPMMPPVGYQSPTLLSVGSLLTMLRPELSKARISWRSKIFNFAGIINASICIYLHTHQIGVPSVMRLFSWCFLVYAIVSTSFEKPTALKQRVELILFNLSSLYAFFCTSYEALFLQMLITELMLALAAQQQPSHVVGQPGERSQDLHSSFRMALVILLYTFFSFFGTGNTASISSFDPNIMRCFLTSFSPFVISALVILKLVIPGVLVAVIIFGLSEFARRQEQRIFICVLLICNVMGMNFLFFVRNQGSWLEIGVSISHFVIMEVTTLGLLVLTCLAKTLLRMPHQLGKSAKLK